MPPTLRERLQKRNAFTDLKRAGDGDLSSASSASSREDVNASLTKDTKVQDADEIGETPPPPPPKSNARLPRNMSPPQSLLDRYKKRSAKLPTPVSPSPHSQRRSNSPKSAAFSEDFDATMPERAPCNDNSLAKDTRKFGGAEFEMLGSKGKAGEAPKTEEDPEAPFYGPRRTRSQTRRQQRFDSLGDEIEAKDFATKDADLNGDTLTPPGTALTSDDATPCTPSPNVAVPVTLDSYISDFTTSMARQRSNDDRRRPETLDDPDELSLTPKPSLSPLPLNFSLRPKSVSRGHKHTSSISAVPVNPPAPNLGYHPAWIWTSPLASTSRPAEPW